tara:strand:- start:6093 stop:7109 length:1017 start_codon:yes stop_codon:yes gene_type:complete
MDYGLCDIDRCAERARKISIASKTFLASLNEEQLALAHRPFDDCARYEWNYTPVERSGLRLDGMNHEQRGLAIELARASLSARGFQQTTEIMQLEDTLRQWEKITGYHHPTEVFLPRNPDYYYFTVYGEPGTNKPWGWKVGGHHIGIHITVIDGDFVVPVPTFFGANPAEIRHGPQKGRRILAKEEDLARSLVSTFDHGQKATAIVDAVAPSDILTANYRVVNPGMTPSGLSYGRMDGVQRDKLIGIIKHYVGASSPDLAAACWGRIEGAGFSEVAFAWAGPEMRGEKHYYTIAGPSFVIEYDNTQNEGNHIHSVWRDFTGDWGLDLLANHYQNGHKH